MTQTQAQQERAKERADDALAEVIQAAKDVGLRIKNEAPDKENPDIFQMDVQNRDNARTQVFRLWRGLGTVNLVDADKRLNQVVIQVQEPLRTIHVWMTNTKNQNVKGLRAAGITHIRWKGHDGEGDNVYLPHVPATRDDEVPRQIYGTKQTPGEKRWFLFGKDESHYFIAQLPQKVKTVREAHDALVPEEVRTLTPAVRKRVQRQGEFFFVPVDDPQDVLDAIQELLQEENDYTYLRNILRTNASIDEEFEKDSTGDHTAEQMFSLGDTGENVEVYVSGIVEHRRHKTLKLGKTWHRVYRNTELLDADGLGFVD